MTQRNAVIQRKQQSFCY